jgi:HD-GYP domain-containing protein (c-di-GMP phosphodiesterase class II)/HAMP domain-containing protein
VNFIHFILEIPFLTTFHPTQFMRFSNTSFRFRIALVLVAVGGLSALLMGIFGFRIMRMELEKSAIGWAQDVACALVDVLERDGITVETLQKKPELLEQLRKDLEHTDREMDETESIWSNLVIAVPEGDQWRIIARQDPKGSNYLAIDNSKIVGELKLNTYASSGSLLSVEPLNSNTPPISLNQRSAGWYKTSNKTMLGAIEPLADHKGLLFLGAQKEIVDAVLFDILQITLSAFGLVALICVFMSWPISKQLGRPIRDIGEFAAALDAGKFDQRLELRGPPEIQNVFKELNTFAKNLGQRDAIMRRNKQLSENLNLQQSRVKVINDLELNFNQISDFDLQMGRVLETVPQVIHAPMCCVFLPDGADFVLAYATRAEQAKEAGTSFIGYITQRKGLLAQAIEHTTFSVEKLTPTDGSLVEAAGIVGAAAAAIAMKSGSGETLGVLFVARQPNTTHASFTEQELTDLRHIATLISTALERRALKEKMMWSKVRMAESRDPSETGPHVKRVSATALEIFDGWAKRRGMREEDCQFSRDTLRMAAILHDVGKIGISDLILKKPGKLTQEEYEIMKHHSVLGVPHLPGNDSEDAREVAMHHHERWDGRGYPGAVSIENISSDDQSLLQMQLPSTGMKGDDIPLFARMVAIADVFDALSSHRAYKEAWAPERVEAEMRKESGKAFDPELIEIFFERLDRIRAARARYPEQIAKPQA